jgi:hypothetical protein
MKNSMEVPQKITNRNSTWSSFLSWAYTQGNKNHHVRFLHSMFIYTIHSSQYVHSSEVSINGWSDNKIGVYITRGSFSHKNEWNPIVCNKMGADGEHYIKWINPDQERQILHKLTQIVETKRVTVIKLESRTVVTRG